MVAGILALLSIIIFAIGLQGELSTAVPVAGLPEVGLFSSGSYSLLGVSMDYSTYLTFGFWLALIAAIIAFVASTMHPVAPLPTPPPPPVTVPSTPES
jgi:tellurite resistance protein TehA-like permease